MDCARDVQDAQVLRLAGNEPDRVESQEIKAGQHLDDQTHECAVQRRLGLKREQTVDLVADPRSAEDDAALGVDHLDGHLAAREQRVELEQPAQAGAWPLGGG